MAVGIAVIGARVAPAGEADLRFAEPPGFERSVAGETFWRAHVPCAAPVPPALLIGARVALAFDLDLDGAPEAGDTLGASPPDCGGEDEGDGAGRIALRRRLPPALLPAVVRADLLSPTGAIAESRTALTAGAGGLLRLTRYCAAPQNGEPEWIEVGNATARPLSLARVKLEGRALAAAGVLEPGAAFVTGADTAELRLWQPGARLVALSSWSNLRNSGDTIRLARDDGLVLDSLVYPDAAHPDGCASRTEEGSAAAASGYALALSAARWSPRGAPLSISVRAPAAGRYDLLAYDLDGRPLCALARAAAGPAAYSLPSPACRALEAARAGRVILHLAPRTAPGVRAVLRITP